MFNFPRTYRLTTKADFKAVFEEGIKINQGRYLALYRKNQMRHARLGIIISKHLIKKATARNYIKRIIREGFRIRKAEMEGLDMVILARKRLALKNPELKNPELKNPELKKCSSVNKVKWQHELNTLWQQLIESYRSASSL